MHYGKVIYVSKPEKEIYKGQNQPVSEVALHSTWKEDLYVILADYREDMSITVKVYVNPMVSWLWRGGLIIAIGTLIAMWPDRLERRRRLERMKKQELAFSPAQE